MSNVPILEANIEGTKGEYFVVFHMAHLKDVRIGPFSTVYGATDVLENYLWLVVHGKRRPVLQRFLWWVRQAFPTRHAAQP